MRKAVLVLLCTVILLQVGVPPAVAASERPISVILDEALLTFDVDPQIVDNRVIVSVRTILENLGFSVSWSQNSRMIATKIGYRIEMRLGEKTAKVNGREIQLDVPMSVNNGRTMVPLRFIVECIGAKIEWNGTENRIDINYLPANPFKMEMLNELVMQTAPEPEIVAFREKSNPRRNGLSKISGKYFDIYYPRDVKGEEVAKFLAPYMDTCYMFLTAIYQTQAPVEIHLVHEEDSRNLKYGEARKNENVTFVRLETDNDQGGNNVGEMLHEMNHSFFSYTNKDWEWVDDDWSVFVDEAASELIPSLYTRDAFKDKPKGYYGYWNIYDVDTDIHVLFYKSNRNNIQLSLNEVVKAYVEFNKGTCRWNDIQDEIVVRRVITFWKYVCSKYGTDKYLELLRTIGKGNYKEKIEKHYEKTVEQLDAEILEYANPLC